MISSAGSSLALSHGCDEISDDVAAHGALAASRGAARSNRLIGFSGRVELVCSDECVQIGGIGKDPPADPHERRPDPVASPSR